MTVQRGAAVLRAARSRAGLTQTELAHRGGITQSVISAYESGRRQPSFTTLSALVEAAGFELNIRLSPVPRRLTNLTGPLGVRVRRYRHDLVAAAASDGVSNLRLFGSVAQAEDRPDSDVDLLVDLPPQIGLIALARVKAELEAILDARVDLVPASELKPDVNKRIRAELIAL